MMEYLICKDSGEIDGKGHSSQTNGLPAGWFKGVTLLTGGHSSKRTHGTDTWWEVYIAASSQDLANESHLWDFETLISKVDLGGHHHDVRRSYINSKGVYSVSGHDENDFIDGILVEDGDYETAAIKAKTKSEKLTQKNLRLESRIGKLSFDRDSYRPIFKFRDDGSIETNLGIYYDEDDYLQAIVQNEKDKLELNKKLNSQLQVANQDMPSSMQFVAIYTGEIGLSINGSEPNQIDNVYGIEGGGVMGGNLDNWVKYTFAARIKIADDIVLGVGEYPANGPEIKTFFLKLIEHLKRTTANLYRSSDGSRETQKQKTTRKNAEKLIRSYTKWLSEHY